MSDVEQVPKRLAPPEAPAADALLSLVYQELRKLAANRMANEAAGHTLQPTALVHEAWLRLVGGGEQQFENRAHFFARRGRSDAAHPHRPRPPQIGPLNMAAATNAWTWMTLMSPRRG